MNAYLAKSSIVAALGGLLFGFDTAVIAGATGALTVTYALTPATLGLTVAARALRHDPRRDVRRHSRRRLRTPRPACASPPCCISSPRWAAPSPWNWTCSWLARFIGGLGIGASSVLGPMYIAEIAPAEAARTPGGLLPVQYRVRHPAGVLLELPGRHAGLRRCGVALEARHSGDARGPVPAHAVHASRESPRWLAKKGRVEEARGRAARDRATRTIARTWRRSWSRSTPSTARDNEPLFQRKYRFPIFLAVSIGMFNQLSGINAILYYLNDIFAKAGFTKVSGDLQAVAIGATNLLFTMLAMSVIDRVGRKKLLLIGSVGTAVALAGVAAIFFTGTAPGLLVWLLVGFIAFFAFSQGAVIWVYLSEVFPDRGPREGAEPGQLHALDHERRSSRAYSRCWRPLRGGAPFVFFAVMMVVQFFVVLATYPETKGYSLEEMQRKLGIE